MGNPTNPTKDLKWCFCQMMGSVWDHMGSMKYMGIAAAGIEIVILGSDIFRFS